MLAFLPSSTSVSPLTASRPHGWSQPTPSPQLLTHICMTPAGFSSLDTLLELQTFISYCQLEICINLKFSIFKTRIHYFPPPDLHSYKNSPYFPKFSILRHGATLHSMTLKSLSASLSAAINAPARAIFDFLICLWPPKFRLKHLWSLHPHFWLL